MLQAVGSQLGWRHTGANGTSEPPTAGTPPPEEVFRCERMLRRTSRSYRSKKMESPLMIFFFRTWMAAQEPRRRVLLQTRGKNHHHEIGERSPGWSVPLNVICSSSMCVAARLQGKLRCMRSSISTRGTVSVAWTRGICTALLAKRKQAQAPVTLHWPFWFSPP